jgi:NAD(P)-dependent dehydrogenase (short-subunit alcohol dehydrogenase family)
VRKEGDAERLSTEFGSNFMPLIFDATDEAAVAKGAKQVEAALGGEVLLGLVNNAGIAVLGRCSISRCWSSSISSPSTSPVP